MVLHTVVMHDLKAVKTTRQAETMSPIHVCTWNAAQVPDYVSIRLRHFVAGLDAVLPDKACGASKLLKLRTLSFMSFCSCL